MENLLNKETVKRVQLSIKKFNSKLEVLVLSSTARTAKDAANSLNCEVGAIVKSLIFKTENSFILCLVSGDKKVSLNKIKKFLKVKDVSMADVEDVKKITGFTIGGVSPIGHLNKIDVYIDKSLERFSNLFAAAGHPNCIFKIDFLNLQKITKGLIKEFTE